MPTKIKLIEANIDQLGELYRYLTGDDRAEDMAKDELFAKLTQMGVTGIETDDTGWIEPIPSLSDLLRY